MIRQTLHQLKRTVVAGWHIAVPIKKRRIDTDASLMVPFAANCLEPTSELRIAVMCHLFHVDLCDAIFAAAAQIPQPADLLISTDTESKRLTIANTFKAWKNGTVTIRVVENRGRDIAPKLITFAREYDRYDVLLFLHTKKSSHFENGDAWRDGLMRSLAGSPDIVRSILQIFNSEVRVGMIIGQHFEPIREWISWNGNLLRAWKLARRMKLTLPLNTAIDFPSGSMFWARPAALRPLISLGLQVGDFPAERGQINKTLHHALERLLLFSCEHAGFSWLKVAAAEAETGTAPLIRVNRSSDVAQFIKLHAWSLLSPDKGGARGMAGRRTAS